MQQETCDNSPDSRWMVLYGKSLIAVPWNEVHCNDSHFLCLFAMALDDCDDFDDFDQHQNSMVFDGFVDLIMMIVIVMIVHNNYCQLYDFD